VVQSLFQGGSEDPGGITKGSWSGMIDSLSVWNFFFLGRCPSVGTDCKFVGNMPTLVQIQLGFTNPPWENPENDIPLIAGFSSNSSIAFFFTSSQSEDPYL
jgi:hypothetical protein